MSNTPDLRKKTIEGVQWNGIGYILYYAFTLLGTAVLSRLILPEEFGSLGILTVLVSITSFMVSLGLDFAVIQNRDLSNDDYSSFFWTNLILGALFSIAFFLSAPLIAAFYNQPDLVYPAQVYAIIFLIQSIGVVPQAILGKQLDFKKRVLAQIIGTIVSFTIAVLMAIKDFGIWCLVAQALIYNFTHVVLNLVFLKWRPTFQISKASFQKVRSFGIHFMAFQLLDVVAVNIDSLLVGKYLGTKELAYFGRAIALVMMPVMGLSMIFTKTFYSFFSAIQNNVDELKKEFVRAGELIVLIAAPVLLWMAIFSTEIVTILFGDQWIPMANILSILAIPSLVSCYFGLTDSFITSIGYVKKLARASAIEKSVYFILILVGLRFGLEGLAYAKLFAILFSSTIKFYLLRNSIQLTLIEWFLSLRKNFIALMAFLLICFLFQLTLKDAYPLIRLLVSVTLSGSVYLATLYFLKSEILLRAVIYFREKLRPTVL